MLLSSFISLSPIATIIACNKKDEITDEESKIDKTVKLFDEIKSEISNTLSNPETKIYLTKDDLQKDTLEIKALLQPLFDQANKDLNQEVLIEDFFILEKIKEYFNKNIINQLNNNLRNKFSVLENIKKIIDLSNLKAKINGNDIKTLIDLISNKQNSVVTVANKIDFDYNLQLQLEFTINLKNKEDTFIYSPKSAFITSDKEGLNKKVFNLADKLREKLANQQLNAKNVIDSVLKDKISYSESFAKELNTNLINKNIKIEKAEQMVINREELSFKLKSWHPIKNNYLYANAFKDWIIKEELITTSEKMFHKTDSQFYQFNNQQYIFNNDNKVFIKNYKNFIVTKWSIEGIELPKRDLENIIIYHNKSDIETSWAKFYHILKVVFNTIVELSSFTKNSSTWFAIILANVFEYNDIAKIIQQWMNWIKSKLTKDDLINFFEDINFSSSKKDSGSTTIAEKIQRFYQISNVLVKLHSEQLCFNLTENFDGVLFASG